MTSIVNSFNEVTNFVKKVDGVRKDRHAKTLAKKSKKMVTYSGSYSKSPVSPSIVSIPLVLEFLEVFPIDLPGMPLDRDIYFRIDLEPDTRPISIPHHYMALTQLRDFKIQLQEFLDKRFACPSASP
ncbi:uncharacterized protein LOC125824273 [Solanum verrucosum]|uniref:uncharacterized protein LOC125824273 n=1 Tax=Solanum verrucosum TaxID=315347 RepID=UPI0020D1DCF3|nr:uncharacterized protein LOC125824273 [Solanum verrucosum]